MIKPRQFIFLCVVILILSLSNLTFSYVADSYVGDIRPLKGPVDINEKIPIWPIILLISLLN